MTQRTHQARLLERFRASLNELDVKPSGGLVVAYSGGPDSTALLGLLLASGWPRDRLLAVHVDHGLRAGSGEEAEVLRSRLERLRVPFLAQSANVLARARVEGAGVEAAGRRERLEILERAARAHSMAYVATGHHLDDQAETILLRLVRGTGLRGLRGILPSRPIRKGSAVRLVRPLLGLRRTDLEQRLAERGQRYLTDPTNADGSNRRSQIRNRLLPFLDAAYPALPLRLAALADRARELYREPPDRAPGAAIRLTTYHRLLTAALREAVLARLPNTGPPLDRAATRRLCDRVRAGRGAADLGAGWSAIVSGEELRLRGPSSEGPRPVQRSREMPLPLPGKAPLPGGGSLHAERRDDASIGADPRREVLDLDAAPLPYTLRAVRAGDRFQPLGFDRETTVHRFLMGRHVPRERRSSVFLVLSRGRPVWVIGHRIDERVKVGPETRARVLLTVEGDAT